MSGSVSVDFGLSFWWKIPNFTGIELEKVESRKISFNPLFGGVPEFWLECYPRGSGKKGEGFVSLYLCCSSRLAVSFDVCLMDGNGEEQCALSTSSHSFDSSKCGWRRFVKREDLLGRPELLPDGTLTVRCIVTQWDVVGAGARPADQYSRLCELSQSLKCLQVSGEHHDVSIAVGDKIFPAHKSVLSARSPVFKVMLSHDMSEVNENKIVISDISENVVREMLEYIYTGESPKLDEMADDLLVAADKYGLETLKEMCAYSLSKNLSAENACRRYLLSSLFNLANLITVIENFASANMESILKSPNFDEIMSTNPDVMKKLLLSHYKK